VFAVTRFEYPMADGIALLFHDRVVARTIADLRVRLDDRLVTNAVAYTRELALFRADSCRRVRARAAVGGPDLSPGRQPEYGHHRPGPKLPSHSKCL
jgi:hypothetical protein